VAQILPGPNVINLALMIGDRHFGLRGAVAAVAGMLFPAGAGAVSGAGSPTRGAAQVAGALRGMGAVAAGLITATGLKLAAPCASTADLPLSRWARPLSSRSLLRWPLVWVLFWAACPAADLSQIGVGA
jgi:chromate transporter